MGLLNVQELAALAAMGDLGVKRSYGPGSTGALVYSGPYKSLAWWEGRQRRARPGTPAAGAYRYAGQGDDETAEEFFDRMREAQYRARSRARSTTGWSGQVGPVPEPEGMKTPQGPPGVIYFSSASPRVAPYAQAFYARQAYQGQRTGGGGGWSAVMFGGLGAAPYEGALPGVAKAAVLPLAPWAGAAEIFQTKEQKGLQKQIKQQMLIAQTTASQEAERQEAFQKSMIQVRAQVESELNAIRALGREAGDAARAARDAAARLGDTKAMADAESLVEAANVISAYVNSVRTSGINTPSDLDAVRVDLGGARSALTDARDRSAELRQQAEGQEAQIQQARAREAAGLVSRQRELERLAAAEASAQRKVLIEQKKAEIEAERLQADQELASLIAVRAQIAKEKAALQKELAELKKLGVA